MVIAAAKMRHAVLAGRLDRLRPWADTATVARLLEHWAASGDMLDRLQALDWSKEVANDLQNLARETDFGDLTSDEVAAVVEHTAANVAAGRHFEDYGTGFFGQIVGIRPRTRRYYLQRARESLVATNGVLTADRLAQGHIAATRWLKRLAYLHELALERRVRPSDAAARRAIQRRRARTCQGDSQVIGAARETS